jgi:hypothetical protein
MIKGSIVVLCLLVSGALQAIPHSSVRKEPSPAGDANQYLTKNLSVSCPHQQGNIAQLQGENPFKPTTASGPVIRSAKTGGFDQATPSGRNHR